MTDDTAYVQDFIDKGQRIPAGEYFCPGGVTIPHDYVDRAEAAGRDHDRPPDYFTLGDMGDAVIQGTNGSRVILGSVRRPLEPGREEPVVICRDDVAVCLPHPASLVLDQFAYEVPGGSPGGFIRD